VPIKIRRKIVCECSRCGYQWQPKNEINKIETCAKCRSPYWNRKKKVKEHKNEY
jgi:predicted Zn-ribbon and HTH transcriptional regulator